MNHSSNVHDIVRVELTQEDFAPEKLPATSLVKIRATDGSGDEVLLTLFCRPEVKLILPTVCR